MVDNGEITAILEQARSGDARAIENLIPIVYGELRRLAHYYMNLERPDHTLQSTALVHEAYLKLVGAEKLDFRDRAHFFAVSAKVMRNLLVDHARARGRAKRGGGCDIRIEDVVTLAAAETDEALVVNEALDELAKLDPRQARIVELRYFGGLKIEEIATVLRISDRTVRREWQMAKAWLFQRVRGSSMDDVAVSGP